MGDLGFPWPPDPIITARLLLRRTEARDRAAYVDLACDEEVYRYLSGPQPRDQVERDLPAVPGDRPGVFAVVTSDELVGTVIVDRRDPDRPGHVVPGGNELELGYLFQPAYWGEGYATEAVAAVLGWIDRILPGEPVVLCTQSANTASVRLALRLGFREVDRFMEFGAPQWFGARWGAPTRPAGETEGPARGNLRHSCCHRWPSGGLCGGAQDAPLPDDRPDPPRRRPKARRTVDVPGRSP